MRLVSPPRLISLFPGSASPELCFISTCCLLCERGGDLLETGHGAVSPALSPAPAPFWARRRGKGSPPSWQHLKRCQGSRCSKGFQVKPCHLALKSDFFFTWISSLCLSFHIYRKEQSLPPFTSLRPPTLRCWRSIKDNRHYGSICVASPARRSWRTSLPA